MSRLNPVLAAVLILAGASGCSPMPVQATTAATLPLSTWTATAVPTASATPSPQPTSTATPEPSPTSTSTEEPVYTPTPGPTPLGGTGKALFSLERRVDEAYQQMGVYLFDFSLGQVETIAGEGYRLQDVSPDGRYLLLSLGSELYLTRQDGSNPRLVTDRLLPYPTTAAVWTGDGKNLAWIEGTGLENRLVRCPIEGSLPGMERTTEVETGDSIPVTLHPVPGEATLVWEYGACQSGVCTRNGIRVAGIDGTLITDIPGAHHPAVSPSLFLLAYIQGGVEPQNQLTILSLEEGSSAYTITLPGNHLLDFSWSPDGKSLAVLNLERSDYSGRWFDIRTILLQAPSWTRKELMPAFGLNARVLWSPDGKNLLLSGTIQSDTEYLVEMAVLDVLRNKAATHQVPGLMSGEEVVLTGGLKWLSPYPFE